MSRPQQLPSRGSLPSRAEDNFREGNGRVVRLWAEDLATAAGHPLDWTRASAERNVHVAVAATHGDYEPMRALLTTVAGGTLGTDRPLDALNDPEPVNLCETASLVYFCVGGSVFSGRLIQAAVGSPGGCGGLRTNRSGWAP